MINHFFQAGNGIGTRSEQNLYQSLTTEIIQQVGADFVYLPRTIVKLDNLFQEDYLSAFQKNYTIEMFIENYAEFLGNGELIGKFGFQLEDQMRLIVSRERFLTVTGISLPCEGDLIWFPLSNGIFEIKFVDDKKPLFPLGARTFFTLVCEVFKYSHETFTTGTYADNIMAEFLNDGATGIPGATGVDPYAKNADIETISGPILNWDERNPFSGN